MSHLQRWAGGVAVVALVAGAGGVAWGAHRLGRIWTVHTATIPVPWPLNEADLARVRQSQLDALEERDERRRAMAAGAIGSASSGASIRVVPFVPPKDPMAGVNPDDIAQKEAMDRGAHLVEARGGCVGCHGADLAGGSVSGGPWLGPVWAPNITPGGVTKDYTPADWERLLRHGVNRRHQASLMPATATAGLADQEVSDLITFLSSVPPEDAARPRNEDIGMVAQIGLVAARWSLSAEQIDHEVAHTVAPPSGGVALGAHLGTWCQACHGPGQEQPELRGSLKGWTPEDFSDFLHSGVRPGGKRAGPGMPVDQTSLLRPAEIDALWLWAQSPAR